VTLAKSSTESRSDTINDDRLITNNTYLISHLIAEQAGNHGELRCRSTPTKG